MSEGKICVPETFSDGEFSQWMRRFDLCSAANKWDDEMKLVRLPTLLRGRAFSVFEMLKLSEEDRKSYAAVKRALTDVMEPNTEERRRHARRQLQQRRLAPKEDADTYVYQLERLLDRACPELSKEVRERELLDRFVDGLPAAIREKLLLVPATDLQKPIDRTRELLLLDLSHEVSADVGQVSSEKAHVGMSHLQAAPVAAVEAPAGPPKTPNLEQLLIGLTDRLQSLEATVRDSNRVPRLEQGPRPRPNRRGRPVGPCYSCGLMGHLSRDCHQRTQQKVRPGGMNYVDLQRQFGVYGASDRALTIKVQAQLNEANFECLVDTGASVSCSLVCGSWVRLT